MTVAVGRTTQCLSKDTGTKEIHSFEDDGDMMLAKTRHKRMNEPLLFGPVCSETDTCMNISRAEKAMPAQFPGDFQASNNLVLLSAGDSCQRQGRKEVVRHALSTATSGRKGPETNPTPSTFHTTPRDRRPLRNKLGKIMKI